MENTFVKFDKIKGECLEDNHKDWIAVKSVEWGVERTVDLSDLGSAQRGYANSNFQKVTLTSDISLASVMLCQYVAAGTATDEVTIEMCRAGDDIKRGMEPYLTFKLYDCVVDSYQMSGGEDSVPREYWTLAYRKIDVSYKQTEIKDGKASSKLKDAKTFSWNLLTGKFS